MDLQAEYQESLDRDGVPPVAAPKRAWLTLIPGLIGLTHIGQHSSGDCPTVAETARDLRDVKRDQGMTQRALHILDAVGADAYQRALHAMRDDTRQYWKDRLSDPPDDGMTYVATAEALKAWADRHWREWYARPIAELQHRDAIRDQALGIAYATDGLEVPAKYEIHLDRKLERTLAMLVKLRELRQAPLA